MENTERLCKECKEVLRGRSDQKFCSDQCRTSFNNKLNRDSVKVMRNVNNILRKNRRILLKLSDEGNTRIEREILLRLGFDFSFHTSIYKNQLGKTYYYCYERGYVEIDKNRYYIVENQISKF